MPLIDPDILAILRCPISGGALELDEANSRLVSAEAKMAFPIRDGIACLLVDEAVPLQDEPSEQDQN